MNLRELIARTLTLLLPTTNRQTSQSIPSKWAEDRKYIALCSVQINVSAEDEKEYSDDSPNSIDLVFDGALVSENCSSQ